MAGPRCLRWISWLALASIVALPVVDVVLRVATTQATPPTFTTTMRAVGLVSAAFGTGLLVAVLVLGLRSPALERTLGPLERLTRMHHVLGVVAYVAILSHPLALAASAAAASWRASARMLFGLDRLTITLGWVGLLTLVLVVCSSFADRLQHETRRRIHAFGWLVVALGLLHGIAARGVRPSDVMLGGVLVAAAGSRLLSAIHTTCYRVEQVRHPGQGVVEVDLAPLRGSIRFQPGQFVFVRFRDPRTGWKCREYHPFTLVSPPAATRLRLAIKDRGDCTRALVALTAGALADVRGPFGSLFGARPTTRQVWLAGGIGIAPFMGAARSLAATTPVIDLFYCTKRVDDAFFLRELEEIATEHSSFHVHHHADEQDGALTAERVLRESRGSTDADFFIAGPPRFIDALRKGLMARHVAAGRIHREGFRYL